MNRILTNEKLNTITLIGKYIQMDKRYCTEDNDYPINEPGELLVVDNGNITQVYTGITGSRCMRVLDGDWGVWTIDLYTTQKDMIKLLKDVPRKSDVVSPKNVYTKEAVDRLLGTKAPSSNIDPTKIKQDDRHMFLNRMSMEHWDDKYTREEVDEFMKKHSHDYFYEGDTRGTITFENWIRTAGPTGWINVTHGGGMYMTDDIYIRTYGGKSLYVNNKVISTGKVIEYFSDERLKTNYELLYDVCNKIRRVDAYKYRMSDRALRLGYEDNVEIGFKASEIEAIFPELVVPAPINVYLDDNPELDDRDGVEYKTIDYPRLTAVLWSALKDVIDKCVECI